MDEEYRPHSLLEVLAVAYGAIAVALVLAVVSALAILDTGEEPPAAAPRVLRVQPSRTPVAGAPVLRANPAMATTTYYLVYSQQQARTIAAIHEKTVSSSTSRWFVEIFASAVVLLVATGEDSLAAQDVINQAYVDYFEGRGPWVNIVDTANWCRDSSAAPTSWAGVPNELVQAIAGSCVS